MKTIIVLVLSILAISTLEVTGQCNSEIFSNECIPKLASGFNFLKTYKVEKGGKDYVEYSYVFTKGTQYMINICAANQPDGIVVSLYDSKRNKVASSKVEGQFIATIAYPCNTTGIYYIQYTFDGSASYCGGSALGFKR
ncbi:MAG: hypothetical protein OEV74_02020 [Cyclobacteriaceae bacterium]|nr:hypothetical protein [Cyclobacteriaceae bacterium]MDH4295028.1 hypothetical protein [Cyclobacteriaceae bacterium]MDH5248495.1 hypothetical protein [Cyclobacteriaceae bacterium]